MLILCSSGKNKTGPFEYIDVNAIICKYDCPVSPGEAGKENFQRLWSNATQWPNGTMPVDGENVTIPENWTIWMDVNPAIAPLLTIDGTVYVNDTRNTNITAQSIWIRQGSLTAGSLPTPYQHKLTIQLNGEQNDRGIVVDPLQAGNKLFVITGQLFLYGIAPSTVQTVLTSYATAGNTWIKVASSSGWAAGDQITIAPTFSNP